MSDHFSASYSRLSRSGCAPFLSRQRQQIALYRIHHLYDYAAINFGHRLSGESYRNHWNHIDSLVRSFPSANDIGVSILKTVGLLNFLNSPEFAPTEDTLVLATADAEVRNSDAVRAAIHRLSKETHILYQRGSIAGYGLWSHLSVNLDLVYAQARRALPSTRKVMLGLEGQARYTPYRGTSALYSNRQSPPFRDCLLQHTGGRKDCFCRNLQRRWEDHHSALRDGCRSLSR